jgi:hypothetical protein
MAVQPSGSYHSHKLTSGSRNLRIDLWTAGDDAPSLYQTYGGWRSGEPLLSLTCGVGMTTQRACDELVIKGSIRLCSGQAHKSLRYSRYFNRGKNLHAIRQPESTAS